MSARFGKRVETREKESGEDVNNKCESRGNNVIMGSATCDTRAIFPSNESLFSRSLFSSLGSPSLLPPKETRPGPRAPSSVRGPCENENGGGKEGLVTGRWLLTSPGSL